MPDFNNYDDSGNIRTRPYGSSSLAVSVAVIVIVLALLVIGGVLIWGARGGDDDEGNAADPTTVDVAFDNPTSTVQELPTVDDTTPTVAGTEPPTQEPSATPTLTATATMEVVPIEEEEIVPTATDVPEPTATEVVEEPTEEPVVEPTSEIEVPDEPEVEPEIGEFGELLPAQLPSGGVSSSLSLTYDLGMSLDVLPTDASAYLIDWPIYSIEDVQVSVEQLGIDGEVVEEGTGVFRTEGETGALYVSPSEIVFSSYVEPAGSELPGDGGAAGLAAEWLSLSGFVNANIDGGTVISRDEDALRMIVVFRPYEPSPNLAPTPSATVTVGAGGEIIEARIHWPSEVIPSTYGLRSPANIWKTVQNGNGFLEADVSQVSATGFLSGTATITDYSIAYTLAGGVDSQFLVPVIQFYGTAIIDQSGEAISISVSVPAVYHQMDSFG